MSIRKRNAEKLACQYANAMVPQSNRVVGVSLKVALRVAHTYITALGLPVQVSNSKCMHDLVKALVTLGGEILEVSAQCRVRCAR